MSLQSGSRLGPYELLAPIGAGGMGEVWRGRDTRLDRSVAVKILPAAFAQDDERRQRFEREAKTISSLSHPHICTLFDVGHETDTHYLVMELLDGESLADRVQKGALPLDQVVKYGAQIASALDAAHRQGIVHRDLKPGNVVLTKTGAKLLDFGLARNAQTVPAVSDATGLPTQAKPLTSAGTVLGTFQYMAPEQIEGCEADARTDIFALGAVLYEMATARRAFDGKSRTSLIAAILSSQPPPISSLQPVMPPALDHVVKKCLEKDPDDRWQSARDVAGELLWIAEGGSQAGVPATLSVRRKSRERIAWALVAALVVAGAAGLGWALSLRGALREASGALRAEIVPPSDIPVAGTVLGAVALSPDGRRLAFVADGPPDRTLAVRDLAGGETKRLAGTEGATFPFWSPDSRWIGYFADRKLRKIEAAGGPVQNVCDANAGRGGSWGRDGTIVFAADIFGPLLKVSSGGGAPTETTKVTSANVSHRNPWFLPDGHHFLLTVRDNASWEGAVELGSLDGGAPVVLLERGSNPQYADGFLFTVVDGNLVAQPFDAERKQLSGQAVPLADGVEYFNARDLGQYSVSGAGLAVYRRMHLRTSQLAWVDRAGKLLGTVGEASYYLGLTPASDRQIVAAVRANKAGGDADVWLLDLQRTQATRATFASAAGDLDVAISPDGTRLAVSASSVGSGVAGASGSVWTQSLSGSGSRQPLLENMRFAVRAWSPDGTLLVGYVQRVGSGFDIAYIALGDPSKVVRITTSPFDERSPALSPDGRWIAYSSNETGSPDVFVSDFPAATRRWQVSRSGGYLPTWRGDGRELYLLTSKGPAAVSVTQRGDALDFGPIEALPFSPDEFSFVSATGYGGGPAIHSLDGKRFLLARYASPPVEEPIRLIRSWRPLVEK